MIRKSGKYFRIYVLLLMCIVVHLSILEASNIHFEVTPTTLDTTNCDYCEGKIAFTGINPNDSIAYPIQYFLTDTMDVIQQVSNQPNFDGVTVGKYHIYGIVHDTIELLQNNTFGNNIFDVRSCCFELSTKFVFTVCPNPNRVKIITGQVFVDINEDGLNNDGSNNFEGIEVRLYEDINQDGVVDTTDILLLIDTTNVSGNYSYLIDESALGRTITHTVIATDTSTFPNDFYLTTDNIETAIFAINDSLNTGNDFGISHTISLENEVWLDLNANGLQEDIEVNIPNVEICISNLSSLLIGGIFYPPNTYIDTVVTDTNGVFILDNLPDCEWQLIAHYDTLRYVPTYDADGNILNVTNFTVTDGKINSANNDWCFKVDCAPDLNFGLRFAGDLLLAGTVCIDDPSKDGVCNTAEDELLPERIMNLFDERGKKLGGIRTDENGAYLFPYLFSDNYLVDLNIVQNKLEDYNLTTTSDDTPAIIVKTTKYAMFQKVVLENDVFGVDFALLQHTPVIRAVDDIYTICPNTVFEENVAINDSFTNPLISYTIIDKPTSGAVTISNTGNFQYTHTIALCATQQFTYQLCDLVSRDCDEATVTLNFSDNTPPTLLNLPQNLSVNCDEQIPEYNLVSAFDNCPNLSIDVKELSTKGEDGCSQYDYELTRIWTATDLCGNTSSGTQLITVEDLEAPDIFRIYTLPNGKQLVAGIANRVSTRWKRVSLPLKFDSKPLLFNQLMTNEGTLPAVVQTRKISNSQFEVRLKSAITDTIGTIYGEVSWIAVEKGTGDSFSTDLLEVSALGETQLANIFNNMDANLLFTNLQTTNQKNPVIIKTETQENSDLALQLISIEENSNINNIPEKIAYWQLEQIGDLHNTQQEIIGETGKFTLNQPTQTITLKHKYYNPIALVKGDNNIDGLPYLITISQIDTNSLTINLQNLLSNLPIAQEIPISYMVIEGSIPLYPTTTFCESGKDGLVLGKDIRAIDNCDNSVELSYTEVFKQNRITKTTERIWKSSDECGNEVSFSQKITCEGVGVKLKTFLQGALLGSQEEGLMRDDLRRKGLIPHEDPYFSSPNFQNTGADTPTVLAAPLLEITGNNAIVDWVFIELRKADNIQEVVATTTGLLQRDGDIISPLGDSVIIFEDVNFGAYYISIRHRNHIGISTKNIYTLDFNTIPEIDFRNIFTPVNGKTPYVKVNNKSALWSGDVNGDQKVIFQGPNNDPFYIFLEVLLHEENIQSLTNFISRGYSNTDFNMDGVVIYQGPNNDRSNLLYHTILAHPDNPNSLSNFVIAVNEGN